MLVGKRLSCVKENIAQISKTSASKKEVISIFNSPAFTQRIVDDVFQKEVMVKRTAF